ncbi:MAG: acylneuraminate cytidylyltransferase family protein [Candidatus Aenigmatarchaeota archaeon]|nr:MAG: acylneuraminate cytidylyltransferase family protein [Candidatus Aenigmarchaeota archaeon]
MIAIIPARSGSLGLPNKNFANLNGMPLIGHTIKYAQKCKCIDEVVVITDDCHIWKYAQTLGVIHIQEPEELATDSSSSEGALIYAINELGYEGDVCFMQCTSPIRLKGDVDKAYVKYASYDSLFSANEMDGFSWMDMSTGLLPLYDYSNRPRRQDIKGVRLIENGSFYMFYSSNLKQSVIRLHGRIGYSIQNKLCGLQIDSQEDLDNAAIIMKGLECTT